MADSNNKSRSNNNTRKKKVKGIIDRSNMAATRGLMLGRFQPFHNGHLALARQILAECDELVVCIGSAQFNFIDKDPFTAGERVLMVHQALLEAGADLARCYVIPVPNDENNARWLAYIRSMLPPFSVLYSGNDFVRHLALSSSLSSSLSPAADGTSAIEIRDPKFARKSEYNGTNIRRLMVAGRPWKHLVPPAVASVIEQVNGVERARVLAATGSDSSPQRW